MSTTAQVPERQIQLADLPVDERRGWYAMWCVVCTEFMLFVCMFAAYYYLGNNKYRWQDDKPPHLALAFLLLGILLASSAVLRWGELQVKALRFAAGRIALWITVLMGLVFLVVQCFEYMNHWKDLTPYSDSYGSIFYAITTLHAAHVIVGLLLLSYVGILPRYGDTLGTPHRAYKTVSIYWHFVDFVWVLVVTLIYVIPNLQVHTHVH